jgi:hypothetical protein
MMGLLVVGRDDGQPVLPIREGGKWMRRMWGKMFARRPHALPNRTKPA